MRKPEKIKLLEILYDLRLGLAEARLTLTAAGIKIPVALQNAVQEDPIKKIRTLMAREKRESKRARAAGYSEGYKVAQNKFLRRGAAS